MSQQKKIILQIVSPGSILGGAEYCVADLAKTINDNSRRYECTILYSHNKNFCTIAHPNTLSYWLGDSILSALSKMRKIIKRTKPDVIHANGYHSLFICVLYRLLFYRESSGKIIFANTEHGWVSNELRGSIFTLLDKFSLLFMNKIFVVDPGMIRRIFFLQLIGKNLSYLPTAIDYGRLEEQATSEIGNVHPMILGVGRLAPEKQFCIFIETAKYLLEQNPDIRFVIVGDGSEKDNLIRLAKQSDVFDKFIFTGFISNIIDFFRVADILLITSQTEGCSRVALEAMHYGAIVASNDVGYMGHLLTDDRGYIFDLTRDHPKDVAALLMRILSRPKSESDQVRQNAAKYADTYHDTLNSLEIYENTISR